MDVPEDPADRLREISLLWYRRTWAGTPFLFSTEDVPRMRELLDGYTHPGELPED